MLHIVEFEHHFCDLLQLAGRFVSLLDSPIKGGIRHLAVSDALRHRLQKPRCIGVCVTYLLAETLIVGRHTVDNDKGVHQLPNADLGLRRPFLDNDFNIAVIEESARSSDRVLVQDLPEALLLLPFIDFRPQMDIDPRR